MKGMVEKKSLRPHLAERIRKNKLVALRFNTTACGRGIATNSMVLYRVTCSI
jgi:hypothetical protein